MGSDPNINGSRGRDGRCPPALWDALAVYVSFNEKIITYAMKDWPGSHGNYEKKSLGGPYHYKDSVYKSLGL